MVGQINAVDIPQLHEFDVASMRAEGFEDFVEKFAVNAIDGRTAAGTY